jgi:hypothetical protein
MLDPASDVLAVQLDLVNFLTIEQRHLSRVSTLDFVNPWAAQFFFRNHSFDLWVAVMGNLIGRKRIISGLKAYFVPLRTSLIAI